MTGWIAPCGCIIYFDDKTMKVSPKTGDGPEPRICKLHDHKIGDIFDNIKAVKDNQSINNSINLNVN